MLGLFIQEKNFIDSWVLIDSKGIKLDSLSKSVLWRKFNTLLQDQNFMHNDIKKWLAERDMFLLVKGEDKVDDYVTDIEFSACYHLFKNGLFLGLSQKADLWRQLAEREDEENLGILIKINLDNEPTYVLPKKNIPFLRQWLKNRCIKLVEGDHARKKSETDITGADFLENWTLSRNGTTLPKSFKKNLWETIAELTEKKRLGFFVKVSDRSKFVLPQENVSVFKQWLEQELGLNVSGGKIAEKVDGDIGIDDFVRNYEVLKPDGTKMTSDEKSTLFKKLTRNEKLKAAGIVAEKKASNGSVYSYVIKDKIAEFNQNSSYIIGTPIDILHELQERAAHAQTPVEKNVYLTQAKKLFEKIHPAVQIKGICPTCLKKISGRRK